MTEASQVTFWPPLLQRYMVNRTRLRLRPHRMMPGASIMVGGAVCCVIGALVALAVQEYWFAVALAISCVPMCVALPYRWRWCDIEQVTGGWRVTTGIRGWCLSELRFGARSIQTWCIDRETQKAVGRVPESLPGRVIAPSGYHVLRLEFVALPFAGDPEPLIIGEGAVLPRDELEALGQVFEQMATGNPPLYPLEAGALAAATAGSPAPRSRAGGRG